MHLPPDPNAEKTNASSYAEPSVSRGGQDPGPALLVAPRSEQPDALALPPAEQPSASALSPAQVPARSEDGEAEAADLGLLRGVDPAPAPLPLLPSKPFLGGFSERRTGTCLCCRSRTQGRRLCSGFSLH